MLKFAPCRFVWNGYLPWMGLQYLLGRNWHLLAVMEQALCRCTPEYRRISSHFTATTVLSRWFGSEDNGRGYGLIRRGKNLAPLKGLFRSCFLLCQDISCGPMVLVSAYYSNLGASAFSAT
jgi:hypothetical protein